MDKKFIILGCVALSVVALIFGLYKVNKAEAPTNSGGSGGAIKTVSGAEFANKWNELKSSGAKLIDVRTAGEYAAGHYEGAEMIDFYSPDFTEQLDKLDKNTQYFIYCRSGARSGKTLEIMKSLGFTKVYNLSGGYAGNGGILPIAY